MDLDEPFEGQKFSSFEVLKQYLEEYGRRHFFKFWIRSSHTISSLKTKTARKVNPDLKYICMKFACIFGGEKTRCRGSGIRKSTTYRNLGCPCTINAVVGEDGNHVKLETVILEHNHALGQTLYESLKKSKSKIKMLETELSKRNLLNKSLDSDSLDLSARASADPGGSDNISKAVELPQSNDDEIILQIENSDTDKIAAAGEAVDFQDYVKEIQEKYGSNVKIIIVNQDETQQASDGETDEGINQDGALNTEQAKDKYEQEKPREATQMCRLCLSTSNKLNPIFKPSLPLESTILSFKIMSCASIEINNNDELPRHICTTCEEILEIAYNFRIRCENSDTILRKAYSSSGYIDINEISNKYVIDNEEDEKCDEISSDVVTGDKLIEYSSDVKNDGGELVDKNVKLDTENETLAKSDETCPICGDNFDTYTNMLQHLEKHNDIENFLLTCNFCSVIFTTVKSLLDHMNEHLIGDNWTNKLISNSETLIASDDVKSEEDGNLLKDSESSSVDANVDKSASNNGYLCNVCGKILKSKDRFQSHKNMHEGLRPHICIKCGRGFADRKNMHQHFDIVHLRKAKHECPICHKKFYAPTKMKSHITMHYGVKPFACDICNKTFRLRMNMVKHKKTHSNERPHKCDKCKAAFIDKNLLTRHSYVHGGIRPHVCPFCGHRFTLKFNLKKHMVSGRCNGKIKDKNISSEYEWDASSQDEQCIANKEDAMKCDKTDFAEENDENESMRIDLLQEYEEKN